MSYKKTLTEYLIRMNDEERNIKKVLTIVSERILMVIQAIGWNGTQIANGTKSNNITGCIMQGIE